MAILKLPRKIEALPEHEPLNALLTRNQRLLWEGGTLKVPALPFSTSLELSITQALNFKQLERGLERIEQVLHSEKKGIDALHKKQGAEPSHRVSRIILITNDGAERFYRSCEKTLLQHQDRVLGIYLDTDSSRLGLKLFGPDKPVKALLVSDKEAATRVLLSLIAVSKTGTNE